MHDIVATSIFKYNGRQESEGIVAKDRRGEKHIWGLHKEKNKLLITKQINQEETKQSSYNQSCSAEYNLL